MACCLLLLEVCTQMQKREEVDFSLYLAKSRVETLRQVGHTPRTVAGVRATHRTALNGGVLHVKSQQQERIIL